MGYLKVVYWVHIINQCYVYDNIRYSSMYCIFIQKEYFPKVLVDPFPRDTYINKNVVRDNNIITAVGNAFVDFSIEILDYFGRFKDEKEKRTYSSHYKGGI